MELIRVFFRTKEVVENTNFWEKLQNFQWRKDFGLCFLLLSNMTNVRQHSIRMHKVFFDIYCATDKIALLGPKRSTETKSWRNNSFHNGQRFWPIFPRIIECAKPQGTTYKGSQAILTITVLFIRDFLGRKRLWKSHYFEKKRQHFQWKETNWPVFFVILSITKIKEQLTRVNKVISQLLWNL